MPTYKIVDCYKCGGSGNYMHFGTCFACRGGGKGREKVYSEAELAAKAKRAEKAAQKRQEEQQARTQAWAAQNPTKAHFLTYDGPNLFIRDVVSKIGRFGSISENQIAAVEKALARDAQRAQDEADRAARAALSQYQGEVGGRQEFTLVIKKTVTIEGRFGTSYLYIMEDAAGNSFKWFASNRLGVETLVDVGGVAPMAGFEAVADGETIVLKGTVKKHDEYKGQKQTILSRCKLSRRLTPAAPAQVTADTVQATA